MSTISKLCLHQLGWARRVRPPLAFACIFNQEEVGLRSGALSVAFIDSAVPLPG